MFCLITLCCTALGIWAERAGQQRAAVRALREQGASVFYSDQKDFDANARPHWLREAIGQDFFSNVVEVEFDRWCGDASLAQAAKFVSLEHLTAFGVSRITDAGVARLARLRDLRGIALDSPNLTDQSLQVLGGLPRLTDLYLRGGRLTDRGLVRLGRLSALRFLTLRGDMSGIADDWMRSVGGLTALEELTLDNANICSRGAAQVSKLKKLRVLNMSNNPKLGDEGLSALGQLVALEVLALSNTGIGSDGLKHLRHLTKLRVLDLSDNNAVGDLGMAYLSELTQLEELKLHATSVGHAGIRNLAPLRKLRCLDLSDNRTIDERAPRELRPFIALECVDLHNTAVDSRAISTDLTTKYLIRLPRLTCVDLSGTGADSRALQRELPNVRVIGSRASHVLRPGMPNGADYRLVCHEASAVERDLLGANDRADHISRLLNRRVLKSTSRLEYTDPIGRLLHQRTLESILRWMVRISRLADVDAQFREQKSLVDAFARRLERMPYSDQAGHAKLFSDVLLAARTNTSLGRLYAAASDLQCADALRSHVEYLDRVNEEWVLTDVESEEREQASSYLSVCMRDASTQLGLNARTPQGRLCDEITVIFDKTREPSKTRPYVSCWEGWKIDSP